MRTLNKAVVGVALSAILGGCGEQQPTNFDCAVHEEIIQKSPKTLVDKVTHLGGFVIPSLDLPAVYFVNPPDSWYCDMKLQIAKHDYSIETPPRTRGLLATYLLFGMTLREDLVGKDRIYFRERKDYTLADLSTGRLDEVTDLLYSVVTTRPGRSHHESFPIPESDVMPQRYRDLLEELMNGTLGIRFASMDYVVSTGIVSVLSFHSPDGLNIERECIYRDLRYIGLKLESATRPQVPVGERKTQILSDYATLQSQMAVLFVEQPPYDRCEK